MADIISAPGKTRKGKSCLRIPRVDLTPMVDLGFLLITFFMYTTTMARPKVMDIQMPYDRHVAESTAYVRESTITIITAGGHKCAVFYNTADKPESLAWCAFQGRDDLRAYIIRAKAAAAALPPSFSKDAHKLHVIIKPAPSSTYDDFVRVEDEMAISEVPYHAIVKLDEQDKRMLAAYGK